MNCGDIERELRRVQAEHAGEHLPMESILDAMHEADYGEHLVMPEFEIHPETAEKLPVSCVRSRKTPIRLQRHR